MSFPVSFSLFLFSFFLFSHSHPTYERDAFLRISCRKTIFSTLSPECKRFFERTRTTSSPFPTLSTATSTPASSFLPSSALLPTHAYPSRSSRPAPPTTSSRSTSRSTPITASASSTIRSFLPSDDTIARIQTIQKQTHTLAHTTRALTSSLASLASLYLAVVAFLKVRKGFSLRRSFSLGLLGQTDSEGIGAGSIPLRIAGPSPMVSTI